MKAWHALFLAMVAVGCAETSNELNGRSFSVDYDHDTFLMDGKPFRFVSGSFHYFRALPGSWRHILRSMRAAGLNAVMTYIEWSTHEPTEGDYKWDGIANLEQFIQIAEEEDLYVILRPGPYICAERDMGGFPYWLLTKYPDMKLRTSDKNYLSEVEKWYSVLMPRLQKYLYGRGGPVIMVSIENEYGSFATCDKNYLAFLRNITESYVQNDAVLFTNDFPSKLGCGHIPGVLTTLNFKAVANPDRFWQQLRKYQPKGPLMNAEFYTGWLARWMEPMTRIATSRIANTLRKMLQQGANVNLYMFFGGTNFAFTSGANGKEPGEYTSDITSYDYDAPLDEAGDPTAKYFALRDVILELHCPSIRGHFSAMLNLSPSVRELPAVPNRKMLDNICPIINSGVPVPVKLPKMKLPPVKLTRYGALLSSEARQALAKYVLTNNRTLSFEALNQHSGFVLYETDIPPGLTDDPLNLKVNSLRDRCYVHVDNKFISVLSRRNAIGSMPISLEVGTRLQLLVENQGRINYKIANDFKGILGAVTLNGNELLNWTMTGFPLENYALLQNYIDRFNGSEDSEATRHSSAKIYNGSFFIGGEEIYDTYLDPTGWGKGVVFVNGFNLGRYWPLVGPQITLYVPRHILVKGNNTITIIEYQKEIQGDAVIRFTDEPLLDGS